MQQRKKPQAAVSRSIMLRAIFVGAVAVISFGIIIYRLVQLQIIDKDNYSAQAANQQLHDEIITPNRGTIYDANMKELARSSTVWTVEASPRDMAKAKSDINAIASNLARILEIDEADVLAKLSKSDTNYQLIKRKIEKPVADALREYIKTYNEDEINKEHPIAGIYLRQDSKRYYPYSNFASTVIGFTNVDGDGVMGLEYVYNDELKGTPGRIVSGKNALGYELSDVSYKTEYPAVNGNGLVLTIDENIQHSAEKYLLAAVKEHNVTNRGVIIAMNPKTGAIYACASMPDFDLNEPFKIADETVAAAVAAITDETERKKAEGEALWAQRRNKAVQDIYEPGSVFKVVTASAALDSGAATLNTSYTCHGSFTVLPGLPPMKCAEAGGHGTLNFAQGLDKSCNPYYINLGQMMGVHTFTNYLQGFGFMEKTGVDMQDEARNQVYTEDKMGIVELASSSFGQSSTVTPISMITAISAAINGGKLVQPHVVSKILDENGNIIKTMTPQIKRQVISEETSKTICKLLEDSVNEPGGHGNNAYVPGYRVGGKSGTSQKLNDPDDTKRIASFVGFAPANDPEIVVLAFLDEPHSPTNSSYGARLSGPIVQEVIYEAMPYLGVEPQYTAEELKKVDVITPATIGKPVQDAKAELEALGLNCKIEGLGGTVTYQYPSALTSLPRTSTVVLYTDPDAVGARVVVPETKDLTVAAATEAMRTAGLNIKVRGATVGRASMILAASQNIPAATEVEQGTLITVNFHDTTVVPEN
ncbi:MAG: penicillin-binding transpeptidase domain-containing protein [Oscillospiraceae bacterium]